MPELPEVEAARQAIEENCVGKKIRKCIVADDPKVIEGASADFEASLTGKTIVAARRKGKNMWLQLDSPPFPSFQFGMAGAIYIKGVAVTKYRRSAVNDTDEWPSKYSKVFIELNDGLEFSFTDKRRFAKVRLLKDPTSVPPISELGPDALLEPMDVDEFIESLSKKKMAIKALLLDQSYIAGIGNWIVDEVLYQARIHPLQIASSLTRENCESLHKCIKEIIDKAVEVGADSSQFPNDWIFHHREKRPGKAFVDGRKIEFITAGGRTSAFVPELQKLTGNQLGRSPSGKSRKKSVEGLDKNEDEKESKSEENPTKGGPKSKSAAKRKVKTSGSEDDEGPDKNEDEEESKSEEKTSKGGPKYKFTAKSKVKTDGSEDEGKLLKNGQMKSKTIADDESERSLKGENTRNEPTKRVATSKKTTKTSPASGQQRKRSRK